MPGRFDRLLGFVAGFFQQGRPESMPRLSAFLVVVTACALAVYGALADKDLTTVLTLLLGSAFGSLMARKSGPVADPAPGDPPATGAESAGNGPPTEDRPR